MQTLAEIEEIERLIENLKDVVRSEVIAQSEKDDLRLPIYKVTFGSEDPTAPVLALFGGVHGLERIGAQVCVSLLTSLSQLVLWDQNIQDALKKIRIVFVPTVNPWGLLTKHRCNPNGVDLMRNAPVEAEGNFIRGLAGHRLSPKLPWYRGVEGAPMEKEAQAILNEVEKELSRSQLVVTVDFHSGFGLQDRVWFPYAKTVKPFPDLALVHSFKELLEKTYPYHFYQIEPQALNYTTHGDLWDYIYDRHQDSGLSSPYLPLCVEMGSWNWVRKNPFQFFSAGGAFNPVKRHRLKRTLRRHNTFFDFLIRAVSSPQAWALLGEEQKAKHSARAMELWYGR